MERSCPLAVAALLVLPACFPPAVAPWPDPSFARPVARSFETVAVLPFLGHSALRRPAEELVALRLREQSATGVMPPFFVARSLAVATSEGKLAEGWREELEGLESDAGSGWSERRGGVARALARVLGADALLVGSAAGAGLWWRTKYPTPDAHAELLLVDGESGEPVARVARRSRPSSSAAGLHEAAMDASSQAADGILIVLGSRPGATPDVRRDAAADRPPRSPQGSTESSAEGSP